MLRLLRAIATTGGASGVAMLLGLATNKIVAVALGPTGIGLLASFRMIQDTVTGLGSIAGAAAQVQALSSVDGEARRRRVVACIWLALGGMAVFSTLLLVAAPLIAEHFFRDHSPDIVAAVRCVAVTFCVSVAAMLAMAFVNVSGALGWLAGAQIAAGVAAVAAAWPLSMQAARGSHLAYVGMILTPLLTQLLLAGFMAWRLGWLSQVAAAFRQRPALADINHFLTFFAANVGGGLVTSACVLSLRAAIIDTDGQDANGLFQAAWTLMQQNMTLLMASYGTYLLPTLSAAHDPIERQQFLDEALPVIVVLSVPLAGLGLLLMPLVLRLLYSAAFLPAMEPLRWMLLANPFSAVVTVFSILLMARGRPIIASVAEAGLYVGFAGIGVAVMAGVIDPARIGLGHLEALGAGFFLMNCLRLACMVAFCRAALAYVPAARVWWVGAGGFGLLLLAAAIGWSAPEVDWLLSAPAAVLICAAPLLLLDRQRLQRLRTALLG